MTLGKRMATAMKYAGFSSEAALAARIAELMGLPQEKVVTQQALNRIKLDKLKTGRSTYIPWIALACGVRLDWLTKGAGPMSHASDNDEKKLVETFRMLPHVQQREILELLEFKAQKHPPDDHSDPPGNVVRLKR